MLCFCSFLTYTAVLVGDVLLTHVTGLLLPNNCFAGIMSHRARSKRARGESSRSAAEQEPVDEFAHLSMDGRANMVQYFSEPRQFWPERQFTFDEMSDPVHMRFHARIRFLHWGSCSGSGSPTMQSWFRSFILAYMTGMMTAWLCEGLNSLSRIMI